MGHGYNKMQDKNILITGERGFLASGIIDALKHKNNIISYHGDVRTKTSYTNIDYVLHCASPSDNMEFEDVKRTCTTIIDGTLNILSIAMDNNAKFVFASTLGVEDLDNSNKVYAISKLAMETYIQSVYNNYIILRIPRVYAKHREKGLMRSIKNDNIPVADLTKMIQYITLTDFVNQTIRILDKTNYKHKYDITENKSIEEIKRWMGV